MGDKNDKKDKKEKKEKKKKKETDGEKDNDKSEEAEKTSDRVKSGAGKKEGEVLTSVADGDKTIEDGTASKDLVAEDVKVVNGAGDEGTKTENGEVNSKDVEGAEERRQTKRRQRRMMN